MSFTLHYAGTIGFPLGRKAVYDTVEEAISQGEFDAQDTNEYVPVKVTEGIDGRIVHEFGGED